MLNAKLTATGTTFRLLPLFFRLAVFPLFLSPRHSLPTYRSVLPLYRNSLSALPCRTVPNKWRDKKDRPDQGTARGRGMDGSGLSENEARRPPPMEKNYKWGSSPGCMLDESQIIPRPRACLADQSGQQAPLKYMYIICMYRETSILTTISDSVP